MCSLLVRMLCSGGYTASAGLFSPLGRCSGGTYPIPQMDGTSPKSETALAEPLGGPLDQNVTTGVQWLFAPHKGYDRHLPIATKHAPINADRYTSPNSLLHTSRRGSIAPMPWPCGNDRCAQRTRRASEQVPSDGSHDACIFSGPWKARRTTPPISRGCSTCATSSCSW
jgi:hypothetical protein